MSDKIPLSEKLFIDYMEKMDAVSDEEIIEKFNSQVGNQGTGTAKMSYLQAIRVQLNKRKIDYSNVGNERAMSYANEVVLKGKKLFKKEQ